jgi:hypothetical protein
MVEAPAEPGAYLLELDLVWEDVAWFGERSGGRTFRAPVEVAARAPRADGDDGGPSVAIPGTP